MSVSTPDTFYRVRHDQIVQEDIDGEVIVINMESGNYYSLRESAVDVWKLLLEGCDVPGICRSLREVYSGDGEDIERAVQELVENLTREGIVTPTNRTGPGGAPVFSEAPVGATKTAFVPPSFEIYTDVQDLLLLDPIHDVTDAGWPYNPEQVEPDRAEAQGDE